jgi:hypothetical protein
VPKKQRQESAENQPRSSSYGGKPDSKPECGKTESNSTSQEYGKKQLRRKFVEAVTGASAFMPQGLYASHQA